MTQQAQSDSMPTRDLPYFRAQIDALDEQLIRTMGKRMRVCEQVAAYKQATDIPMMQNDRVREVRDRVNALAQEEGLRPRFIERLYALIVDEACHLEDELMDSEVPRARRVRGVDHVVVAVEDLEAAVHLLSDGYGFDVVGRRSVGDGRSGMTSVTLRAGGAVVVLCEGTSPDSSVSRFVEAHGPGVQRIALEVDGHQEFVDGVRAAGSDVPVGPVRTSGLDRSVTRRDVPTGVQWEFLSRASNAVIGKDAAERLFEAMEGEGL